MDNIEKIIFVAALVLLTLIGFITYIFVKKHLVKTVKKSSNALSELETINSKIKYKNVEKNYLYSYSCFSRAEFNRLDLDDYFIEIISDNENYFQKLMKAIENNKKEIARLNCTPFVRQV